MVEGKGEERGVKGNERLNLEDFARTGRTYVNRVQLNESLVRQFNDHKSSWTDWLW